MLRDGVIEPVDCSEWASPLVAVNRADGALRICADYKATLNPALLVDRYPLPKIDDVIVRMSGSMYFSKIDLSQAYNQVELDETKFYTVINTHRGLFRYNRLVYGLASSAGIFQRIMCNLLQGIPNVEIFLDDVIIGGRTKEEHLSALETVFQRLHQSGFKLKRSKCVFLVEEIKYLGYVLSRFGVRTDPEKVEAITKIPRPNNVSEVRSFLGLVNFYAKFVRNMSAKLVPLYELLKKGKQWVWSAECENAFNEIKMLLSGAEVLAHYDPHKQLIVTCDASARGVGGVLSQPGPDGRERPVAYASRTLTDAEKNYSQIHREALAIIFCMGKFHQYIYGRRFVLRTDHKPLVSIFGPNTGIPAMAASRMQRWAIILSAYSYDIEYVRTNDNGADGLSRLPVKLSEKRTNTVPEQTYFHFVQDALLLNHNEIRCLTRRDSILSKVIEYIRNGWPDTCESRNLQPYYNRRTELYEELGTVMWGHRVVIPELCKARVLGMLHEPHMGIVKSKALARSYVWWAGVDEDVERMCRQCAVCAAQADAPPRHAPRPWPWPHSPWSRVHVDFLGPIYGKLYLVAVDAMSKWIEVFNVPSTVAKCTIDRLSELFSRFGIVRQLVSDNGPPFTSSEFKQFTNSNGIEHIFTAPYHPASNGAAENAVKTIKSVIKKAVQEKQDIDKALRTFLMYYRNTEHSTTGETPATLLLGRRIRTRLDMLKPDRLGRVQRAQQNQKIAAGGVVREVNQDELVWYRQYLKGEKWCPGQVVSCVGPSNYTVRDRNGVLVHKHIDQLKVRNSRRSLACPTPNSIGLNSQPQTTNDLGPPGSPASGAAGSAGSPRAAVAGARAAAASSPRSEPSSSSPSSPEWHFASPSVAPPSPRPIRKCRIDKKINYKI
ncbi:uncharacterized protein K02A2.6-like isoform X1 [Plutella xylostella]|uniref:uncharacterized protein K02A2.6-like isoform X1 n=1 Tax=Plutella xylostella TaxID=51655 RepID=UPI002032916B|nr:uncharacterized protein K02A2.6-like isoform X1 [Plutella xylostella]